MSTGKYRKEHNCLNCGEHVEKHYCSNCGQQNLELKESFWGFISHSIAHYFHFDNKFFHTLVPLLSNPGQVTLDYLSGKRARYINPVSMYIFVSIVYFLVVYSPEQKNKEVSHVNIENVDTKEQEHAAIDSLDYISKSLNLQNEGSTVTKKAKEVARDLLTRKEFGTLSFQEQAKQLNQLKEQHRVNPSDSLATLISKFSVIHDEKNDSTYAAYLARQQKLPLSERDNWMERMAEKRAITLGEKSEVIQETLERNRPKQYFLLMPLLAWFIMINFRRNHIYYLDHLIFTIHGMTAYFIIEILTQPFIHHVFGEESIFSSIIGLAVFFFMLWYMYKALIIFYQRSKRRTYAKILTILILFGVAFKLTEMVMINLIYFVAV
ncbi:DUF3667 domain-containing protein [Pedobacter sp.]|uniref:DUF3667 domain-containing protein n=1 Tax=Pedobacter sp. TaxID=1411316 RepID=UPI003D7F40D7